MGQLDGKIAIITGATSGIGERTAEVFIEEGATVVLAGRRAELGQAIAARLGQNASFVQADVAVEADVQALRARYRAAGVQAVVMPFLHRMGLAWGAADVALTRAGANSVAEAEINRVPCLFVPYPYHRDLHQRENARELVEAGAAAIALDAIEPQANMQVMGRLLESLLSDGPARDRMCAALAARPRVDAAENIAKRLIEAVRAIG